VRRLLGMLLLCAVLAGCSANPKPVTGSANQFDSDSYLALLTTDNVIQSTKAALAAGSFPVSVAPTVKTALNALIKAYDVADPVYITYHNAALAGSSTPAQQAAVTSALANVNTATATLVSAKGGQ
jgi:hypothetical protein